MYLKDTCVGSESHGTAGGRLQGGKEAGRPRCRGTERDRGTARQGKPGGRVQGGREQRDRGLGRQKGGDKESTGREVGGMETGMQEGREEGKQGDRVQRDRGHGNRGGGDGKRGRQRARRKGGGLLHPDPDDHRQSLFSVSTRRASPPSRPAAKNSALLFKMNVFTLTKSVHNKAHHTPPPPDKQTEEWSSASG
ncbi:hypothetical protein E2C01_038323 [Portunus trituberculatus]|uniref:Uncharacterized protein n=1 Tax=Portunus trituberculatus TaxID=210409 RepID=A0A5B7FGX8_PORTR|nr:hypothetical protein [Portunus trituberculatus]